MSRHRQLLCAALVCLPTAIGQETSRTPVKPYTTLQIDVPLGLLPHHDLLNPGYGMDGHDIAWMEIKHFDDLAYVYVGHHPDVWPPVLLHVQAKPQPWWPLQYLWWLLLPVYALVFYGLACLLKRSSAEDVATRHTRLFYLDPTTPAMRHARPHSVLAVELDLLAKLVSDRERGDVERDRWSHQALAAPGKIERSLQAYKFITMEFLLGGEKLRRALRHVQ
jgi:hypothetical protein